MGVLDSLLKFSGVIACLLAGWSLIWQVRTERARHRARLEIKHESGGKVGERDCVVRLLVRNMSARAAAITGVVGLYCTTDDDLAGEFRSPLEMGLPLVVQPWETQAIDLRPADEIGGVSVQLNSLTIRDSENGVAEVPIYMDYFTDWISLGGKN